MGTIIELQTQYDHVDHDAREENGEGHVEGVDQSGGMSGERGPGGPTGPRRTRRVIDAERIYPVHDDRVQKRRQEEMGE